MLPRSNFLHLNLNPSLDGEVEQLELTKVGRRNYQNSERTFRSIVQTYGSERRSVRFLAHCSYLKVHHCRCFTTAIFIVVRPMSISLQLLRLGLICLLYSCLSITLSQKGEFCRSSKNQKLRSWNLHKRFEKIKTWLFQQSFLKVPIENFTLSHLRCKNDFSCVLLLIWVHTVCSKSLYFFFSSANDSLKKRYLWL